MKALCIYLALGAVLTNIAGNMMANSTEGLRAAQQQRTERLCQINTDYC